MALAQNNLPYVKTKLYWSIIARAVYVARTGRRLTVLHVFAKKTQKTPRKAIDTAQARLRKLNDD